MEEINYQMKKSKLRVAKCDLCNSDDKSQEMIQKY